MKLLKWGGFVLAAVVLGGAGFLHYLGMFSPVVPEEKVMGPFIMAYEPFTGDYKQTGAVFDRVYKALKAEGVETTRGLGIYYDDPRATPAAQLRSDCGSIIEEKDLGRVPELLNKFKIKTVPQGKSIVVAFPVKNPLSYMLGPIKAYPALAKYAQEHGGKPVNTYELYDMPNKTIYFVMTLGTSGN